MPGDGGRDGSIDAHLLSDVDDEYNHDDDDVGDDDDDDDEDWFYLVKRSRESGDRRWKATLTEPADSK